MGFFILCTQATPPAFNVLPHIMTASISTSPFDVKTEPQPVENKLLINNYRQTVCVYLIPWYNFSLASGDMLHISVTIYVCTATNLDRKFLHNNVSLLVSIGINTDICRLSGHSLVQNHHFQCSVYNFVLVVLSWKCCTWLKRFVFVGIAKQHKCFVRWPCSAFSGFRASWDFNFITGWVCIFNVSM